MNLSFPKRLSGSILIILLIGLAVGCSRAPRELNVFALEGEWFGRVKWSRYGDTLDIKVFRVEPSIIRCEVFAGAESLPDERIVYDFKVENPRELTGVLSNASGKISLTADRKIVINLVRYPVTGDLKATLIFSDDEITGTFVTDFFDEPGTVTLNRK